MSLNISASGLTAQRIRLSVLANNIANAATTRTPEGGCECNAFPAIASGPRENRTPVATMRMWYLTTGI